jgi:hypothetical protein
MGFCPICKTSASLEQATGGDYQRVECRKCGRFQITGTALAMLPSRLADNDKKRIARLSHAIRLMSAKTDAKWPEVNSVNLDDMIKQPLPTIEKQITNLLVWAAATLGDDQLGSVELPDEDDLTGIIGTIDGQRVDDLVSRAERDGLVEFVPDHCIRITEKGWARLQPPAKAETTVPPPALDPPSKADRITKAHCNKCHGIKNSWVRADHLVSGSDGSTSWSHKYEVLQCCGCDTLSVRHEHWFSEWDQMDQNESGQLIMVPGIEETYYPPPTVRPKPPWSDKIDDDVLRDVLDELYSALTGGLYVLASVGARTLLDRAGYLLIGDPKGGFEGKLSALVAGGFISSQDKEALDAVADAGNASAHRGYTPTPDRLGHIVDIIENFLQRAFVLKSAAAEIRKSTPRRGKPH